MRISDWSSDVCSSDLPSHLEGYRYAYLCAGWISDRRPRPIHRQNGQFPERELATLSRGGQGNHLCGPLRAHQRKRRVLSACRCDQCHGQIAAGDRKSTRRTPVTNAHLVCRLLLEKKKIQIKQTKIHRTE